MFTTVLIALLLIVTIAIFAIGKIEFQDGADTQSIKIRWFALIPFGLAILITLFVCVTTVDGGHVGVKKTFGKFESGTLSPGVNFKAPWQDIVTLDTRTQEYTMSHASAEGANNGDDSIAVTARDQIVINTDATILYHIDGSQGNHLLQQVGTDYVNKLVRPSSRQIVRDKGTQFDAVELVTSKRVAYATSVKDALTRKLGKYGIVIDDVQIRDMTLPQSLQDAVNAKASASQKADAKIAELRQAQLDADITRTAAKATADSQQIVACGGTSKEVVEDGKTKTIVVPNYGDACDQSQLTPEFLQSQYIQAIKGMVNSPNNSTLILPTDKNLTPLLNVGK